MHEAVMERRARRARRLGACVLLAAVLLPGCAVVGPDYQPPAAKLPPAFVQAGAPMAAAGGGAGSPSTAATSGARPTEADIATFWRGFGDAALTALVERALQANGELRIAQARLQESRAGLAEAQAQHRPDGGVAAGATRSVRPITQQPGASRSDRTGNVVEAGFVARWELDLFGGLQRGSEAAAARVASEEAGLGVVHTSVAAEVARHYLELRGLQQRQKLTEAALANQRESLQLLQARLDAGRGTPLDTARASTLVASLEAALPPLQAGIERSAFRLATLSAQPPGEVLTQLAATGPLPALPVTDLGALPLGTPEQWLQRRPDLAAAERQLAAATAAIGVAQADLFPRLSLSGLLGLNAPTVAGLGRASSAIGSLGVGFAWAPFDGGRIRARIAASEARALGALASYEQAVMLALEETEGAFSAFNRSAQRSERLDAAAASAEEAVRLARERYALGAADFLTVLDAERVAIDSRDQWMQAQIGTATALVSVYRALGGGWSLPSTVSTASTASTAPPAAETAAAPTAGPIPRR